MMAQSWIAAVGADLTLDGDGRDCAWRSIVAGRLAAATVRSVALRITLATTKPKSHANTGMPAWAKGVTRHSSVARYAFQGRRTVLREGRHGFYVHGTNDRTNVWLTRLNCMSYS